MVLLHAGSPVPSPSSQLKSGLPFRCFRCLWIGPPPSPWTDASGLSVDASGLVPPHQVWKGGDGGDSLKITTKCIILSTQP